MWSISLTMQNPLPCGTTTNIRLKWRRGYRPRERGGHFKIKIQDLCLDPFERSTLRIPKIANFGSICRDLADSSLLRNRPLQEEPRHREHHEVPRGQRDVEGEAPHVVLRLGEVAEEADDLESALVEEAVAVVAEFSYLQL